MKVIEIPVHCWNCGEVFYIEIANVKAGHLFCSEKCWKENLEKERELEKKKEEKNYYCLYCGIKIRFYTK